MPHEVIIAIGYMMGAIVYLLIAIFTNVEL